MKNTVDYDEMFGTSTPPEADKKRKYEERCRRANAERNELNDSVENFRNRPKNREGLFDRADCFSDESYSMRNDYSSMTRFQRDKYTSEEMRTVFWECFDGVAVGTLLAVVVWILSPVCAYVTVAGAVGFIVGLALKLLLHDRFPMRAALKQGLRYIPVGVFFTVIVSMLSGK